MWLAVAALSLCARAFAAHPLQTEDTGTQGEGNIEWENGLSWSRAGAARVFAYQPQFSFGFTPALDLIVQPAWLSTRDDGQPSVSGFGDTNLDAKWRFFGEAPWSLGVRAGATAATGRKGLGLRHDTVGVHALFVATYDAAPVTVHANLGASRAPQDGEQRSVVLRASTAVMWAANERLTLTVDAGAGSDPDRSRHAWPATVLLGAIYTLRPGLDVDAGCQKSVDASPASRQALLGLTYRFAP